MIAGEDGVALESSAHSPRAGWAEATRMIAEAGDDALVIGEFGNAADSDLIW